MIEFRGLTKRYGQRTAVDSLKFSVPDGALFGFLGPNGAGKTTTIRMLMGLLHPSAGQAFIDNIDVTRDSLEVRRRVGHLPDEIFLYDYLTGRQFLEFIGDIHRLERSVRDRRISEYLEFFQLDHAADEFTTNYSFGMKKKLALAGIVLHEPKVLLLDEPFNGLDPQAVKDLRQLLEKMRRTGATILFSSHVLEVVEKLVTHVGIIASGRLRSAGTLEEVTAAHGDSLEKAYFAFTEQSDAG
ncbi:MAG TPA: ABC transporter ATP-binding protein [Candidatus Ozemobacteraceae bacterium]|nr:ABC transporter ATP-binding protein [Candidatus Ozemobacteraceae bacterium]